MGKGGKKTRTQQKKRGFYRDEEDADSLPSSAYDLSYQGDNKEESNCDEEENGDRGEEESDLIKIPSKFSLYQKSVQSPKGDISYLQKFFLMYVGGRFPLHFQEDFCGTALLSTEWLHSDPRRTSIGIDLDLEALTWCLNNNINKIGSDGYSRLSLFHGNVLQPSHAILVSSQLEFLVKTVSINENDKQVESTEAPAGILKDNYPLPARDIVCAFNYSCCCLQKRADLILYFKHAFGALSKKGGIFVMDLYGGTSSEHELRLQRTFPGFTYVWEQEEFDVISRTTRISLHFHVGKKKKQVMRHAFTYHWRLWSLPEVKDCLEEAGFRSIHFWIREMPDTRETEDCEEFDSGKDVKYEEVSSFPQRDAWNAYIVAVAN